MVGAAWIGASFYFNWLNNNVRAEADQDERLAGGIECLQGSVTLCNYLELHDRCGEMLQPLTSFICPDDFASRDSSAKGGAASGRYNIANLICVEDVLKNGFELASQSQDCWKYVMK